MVDMDMVDMDMVDMGMLDIDMVDMDIGHGGHIQVTNLPSPIWSSFYCFWIPHNHQDFPYLDLASLHLLLARKGNAD